MIKLGQEQNAYLYNKIEEVTLVNCLSLELGQTVSNVCYGVQGQDCNSVGCPLFLCLYENSTKFIFPRAPGWTCTGTSARPGGPARDSVPFPCGSSIFPFQKKEQMPSVLLLQVFEKKGCFHLRRHNEHMTLSQLIYNHCNS